MNEIDNPDYWLNRIAEGNTNLSEVGPAKLRPGRDAQVVERLAELNSERLLYQMRTDAGMTQAEVAKRLGISRPAATQLENKPAASMTLGTFAKYAQACGFEFDPAQGIQKVSS